MGFAEALDAHLWMRIACAMLCGAILGTERQLRGKPAGIRTSILVCLGTVAYVRIGVDLGDGGAGDASRVVGQVVTGVGFLGAGVMLTREGLVVGVTSAATIWIIAAIGCAIGVDRFGYAIALTLASFATLVGVHRLEAVFRWMRRGVYAFDYDVRNPGHGSGLPRPASESSAGEER